MLIAIKGVVIDEKLRARVRTTLAAAAERLPVKPVAVQATFFDENGPKGGVALRCGLTVRVAYRPHLRAEGTAVTARRAFDSALAKLERELDRYRERDRESKRHPKKYYAASRISEQP